MHWVSSKATFETRIARHGQMMNDEEDQQPSSRRPMGVDDYSAERVIRGSRDSVATSLQGKPALPRPQAPSSGDEVYSSDGSIPVHVDSTPPEGPESMASEAESTPSPTATTSSLGRARVVDAPSPTDLRNQPRFWPVVLGVTALTGVAMFLLGRML